MALAYEFPAQEIKGTLLERAGELVTEEEGGGFPGKGDDEDEVRKWGVARDAAVEVAVEEAPGRRAGGGDAAAQVRDDGFCPCSVGGWGKGGEEEDQEDGHADESYGREEGSGSEVVAQHCQGCEVGVGRHPSEVYQQLPVVNVDRGQCGEAGDHDGYPGDYLLVAEGTDAFLECFVPLRRLGRLDPVEVPVRVVDHLFGDETEDVADEGHYERKICSQEIGQDDLFRRIFSQSSCGYFSFPSLFQCKHTSHNKFRVGAPKHCPSCCMKSS